MGITENELMNAGLSGKQATVYLALLNTGKASATQLARETGIKRTSIYDITAELLQRGIIAVNNKDARGRYFYALDPENLKEKPRETLNVIDKILPDLISIYESSPEKPGVRFFEGAAGLKKIHEELLEVKSGEYFYFDVGIKMIDLLGADYLKNFVKRRVERGIWSNSIRLKDAEVDVDFLKGGEDNLRNVRFFPELSRTDFISMYIYDNKLGIASSRKEGYGIIIKSDELASSMKIIWDMVWKLAESN
ncbi:MAG: helix-turn-helix domain-containing protein [Spirochaetales bacterium]|nr:helix-turn-helix domain-containing protein [Spirochaetales bacterium]